MDRNVYVLLGGGGGQLELLQDNLLELYAGQGKDTCTLEIFSKTICRPFNDGNKNKNKSFYYPNVFYIIVIKVY